MNDHHDPLGASAQGLADSIEAELARDPIVADLDDVFARARMLDASAIPEGLAPPSTEARAEADPDAVPLDLAPFATALRFTIEDDLARRAPAPAPPQRRLVSTIAWLGAAAAIVLAMVSLPRLLRVTAQQGETSTPMIKPHTEDGDRRPTREAGIREPEPERERRARRPRPELPEQQPALPEDAVEELVEAPLEEPAETKRTERTKRRSKLDELERRARARWAAGDLAEAEQLLRQVIARGGKGQRAELAYGDLFAIAKQRNGSKAQAKVWREYLRRFPRGRYADDVRAGLCRRGAGEQRQCWAEYLERHPDGAHSDEAKRAVEEEQG